MFNNRAEAKNYIFQHELFEERMQENKTVEELKIVFDDIFKEYDFRLNKRNIYKEYNLRRTLVILAEYYIQHLELNQLSELDTETIDDISEKLHELCVVIYKCHLILNNNADYNKLEDYFEKIKKKIINKQDTKDFTKTQKKVYEKAESLVGMRNHTFLRKGNRFSFYELICEANANINRDKDKSIKENGELTELRISAKILEKCKFKPIISLLSVYYHYKSKEIMDSNGYIPFSIYDFVAWFTRKNPEEQLKLDSEIVKDNNIEFLENPLKIKLPEELCYDDQSDDCITIYDDGGHMASDMLAALKNLKLKMPKESWDKGIYTTKEFSSFLKNHRWELYSSKCNSFKYICELASDDTEKALIENIETYK